jgi:peptidoglycan/LPS O-acetylase OafA/YrhL
MVIPLCLYLYVNFFRAESIVAENLVVYLFVVTTTIVVSGLSYNFFEKWFISLKGKYSHVRSGDANP